MGEAEQAVAALARAWAEGDATAGLILHDAIEETGLKPEWHVTKTTRTHWKLLVGQVHVGSVWVVLDGWRWRLMGKQDCCGNAPTMPEAKAALECSLSRALQGPVDVFPL